MLYRINRLFNVPKRRAAVIAVLCTLAALPFLFNPDLAMFGLMFLMYAVIYGCIWLYKFNRDKRLQAGTQTATRQAAVIEPPITSPGSHRLFVPPSLDRHM